MIDVELVPALFTFQMEASLTILGITNEVVVDISDSQMTFTTSGLILGGVFLGDLFVSASTDDWAKNSFSVAGNIHSNEVLLSLIEKVSAQISSTLKDASDQVKKANKALTDA